VFSAFYTGTFSQDPKTAPVPYYESESAVLGTTTLQQYSYSDSSVDKLLYVDDDRYPAPHYYHQEQPLSPSIPTPSFNLGERDAFIRCVESFLLDTPSRMNKTVKVNVAWDENDYQIDVGTDAGVTEYKRIIDRNAQFGVTHIVYEPRNTLHSSRFNTTDGWGWEGSLWFSMGEDIRELRWDPTVDKVPQDILEMVQYAETKGVGLLAYVYPCLAFQAQKEYLIGNTLNIAPIEVQDWLIHTLRSFMQKTGAQGFAWDHNIFAGSADLRYAQWRGWMRILASLRAEFPDMVMDHRQTAHMWGPWYQLAGSYSEPIAGDENPETYGVPIASLHTDHVAADNTRRVNYKYSLAQMLPPSRIPGFIFHQTERTDDNGTNACFGNVPLCYDMNVRDFDLLGYKYSLLSTIGTAGQNNVLTMIPARDMGEFTLFPSVDLGFIRSWLAWTDSNLQFLRNTMPIATLSAPSLGNVDGTSAMYADEGYLFMFNPNMRVTAAHLIVDESMGLSNNSATWTWEVTELYPKEGKSWGTWTRGQNIQANVTGSDALVLELRRTSRDDRAQSFTWSPDPRMYRTPKISSVLTVAQHGDQGGSNSRRLVLEGASGVQGAAAHMWLGGVLQAHSPLSFSGISVNGVDCKLPDTHADGSHHFDERNVTQVQIQFAGTSPVYHAMPIDPSALAPPDFTGGWFNITFSIPSVIKQQLSQRKAGYPIEWQPAEYKATWLVPSRLLMYIFIAEPQDSMDVLLVMNGTVQEVGKSYNSRGLVRSRCFLGFYYDASALPDDAVHHLAVKIPTVAAGQFQGIFWENVETEYTDTIESCSVNMK